MQSSNDKAPLAVMTMVRGDHHWAVKWRDHYLRHVRARRDLYVLIHGDDPVLMEIFSGCNVMIVPLLEEGGPFFEKRRLDFEHFFIRGLQAYYRCVLMVDIDELVCPAPGIDRPLWAFLPERHEGEMVRSALGFEVLDRGEAEPLDLTRPILSQRRTAFCNAQYCKPCVFYFNFGGATHHRVWGAPWVIDPDLLLFHLRYADRTLRAGYFAERRAYYARQVEEGGGSSGSWRRPRAVYSGLMSEVEAREPGILDAQCRTDLRAALLTRLIQTNRLGGVASGLLTMPDDYADLC